MSVWVLLAVAGARSVAVSVWVLLTVAGPLAQWGPERGVTLTLQMGNTGKKGRAGASPVREPRDSSSFRTRFWSHSVTHHETVQTRCIVPLNEGGIK